MGRVKKTSAGKAMGFRDDTRKGESYILHARVHRLDYRLVDGPVWSVPGSQIVGKKRK